MDCQMPEMDGFAAAGEIRKAEPRGIHTPVIALIAGAMPEDRTRCLAAGMDSYLSKPVSLGQLRDALEQRAGRPVQADEAKRSKARRKGSLALVSD